MWTYRILVVATAALTLAGCARPVTRPPAAPDPVGPSPTVVTPPGDGAPHNAENNGWKRRAELGDADRKLAEQAVARIRTALEAQRAVGDFSLPATLATLVGLGFPADQVQVATMNDPTITGAVYGVHVGERGCVIGNVQPLAVRAEVAGSAAEFGCLEPFSH